MKFLRILYEQAKTLFLRKLLLYIISLMQRFVIIIKNLTKLIILRIQDVAKICIHTITILNNFVTNSLRGICVAYTYMFQILFNRASPPKWKMVPVMQVKLTFVIRLQLLCMCAIYLYGDSKQKYLYFSFVLVIHEHTTTSFLRSLQWTDKRC